MNTPEAIMGALSSPNVSDSNFESANVVDVLNYIANGAFAVANAITPRRAAAGHDQAGGHIESLTEAVMGITGGLVEVASSIGALANAVEELAAK